MTPNETLLRCMNLYQELALRTEAPTDNVPLSSFPDDKLVRLIHAMSGLLSESGEIADTIKRHAFYNQPLDEENLKEEAGDVAWYLALLCDAIGVSLEDVLISNIKKLQVRFPEEFTEHDAEEKNRDRKREMTQVTIGDGVPLKVPVTETILSQETKDKLCSWWQNKEKFKEGFLEGVELAIEVADLMDGQNRKEALKMIERRKDATLKEEAEELA